LQEIKKYEFGAAYNGITSVPNFIKIRRAIFQLLNAKEPDITRDDVIRGLVCMRRGSWVMASPSQHESVKR
jgi:hypothetical protein